MTKIQEIWKDVVGYEGLYQVSNLGRVKTPQKILKSYGDRYSRVRLYKNKKSVNGAVHRLVAIAFIPNPKGKLTVNHINGNSMDNRVTNLEWATHRENVCHYYKKVNKFPIGVTSRNGKFYAHKHVDGRLVHIGTFSDSHGASMAYQSYRESTFSQSTDKP